MKTKPVASCVPKRQRAMQELFHDFDFLPCLGFSFKWCEAKTDRWLEFERDDSKIIVRVPIDDFPDCSVLKKGKKGKTLSSIRRKQSSLQKLAKNAVWGILDSKRLSLKDVESLWDNGLMNSLVKSTLEDIASQLKKLFAE